MSNNGFQPPWVPGRNKDYSQNKNFAVGVDIIFQWITSFSNATITLWQDNRPGDAQGGPSVILERSYNLKTWSWKVSYSGLDPALINVYYIAVTSPNGGSDGFTSHYFNISDSASSSSTAITSITSSIRSTSGFPSITATASNSAISQASGAAATVTLAPSDGRTPPVGTYVGATLGAVVGLLILLGIGVWAWRSRRKRRGVPGMAQTASPWTGSLATNPTVYVAQGQKLHEADASFRGYELRDSQGPRLHELQGVIR